MRYKNGKQYQICHHQIRFFELKMHQNMFSYDAPLDPLIGWGGGYPLPIPLPARRLRRLELGASVLRPPQHKILATPVQEATETEPLVETEKTAKLRDVVYYQRHRVSVHCLYSIRGVKGAITSKIKHAIKRKTSPARLAHFAQLLQLQPSLAFCFSLQPMTAYGSAVINI